MSRARAAAVIVLVYLVVGCAHRAVDPPLAKIEGKRLEIHGDTRIDEYYWLSERENPEVIRYLEAENSYTDAMTVPFRRLERKLFAEIKGRIKQADMSVPVKQGDYSYYTRFEDGEDYPTYCRKRDSPEAVEEVMLDANAMAKGHEYFRVGSRAVSFGQDLLAYAVDTVGRRIYTIEFKNLATGESLADVIPGVTGNVAWANDDRTLFYSRQDPTTLRSYRIYRHVLGTDAAHDELVYEETDDTFTTFVFKTKSRRYLMIASFQTLSSEFRYLDADDPQGKFELFQTRERDHEYTVDHRGDHFYVRTNDGAKNFRLIRTPLHRTGRQHWEEVIPHREDVLLEDFEVFEDHLVLTERKNGLVRIRIQRWAGGEEHSIEFGEPAYLAYVDENPEFASLVLRFGYQSMTTPNSIYDYDMVTREKTLLKREEVLGGFDPGKYRTERLHAPARDGTRVPISLVYREGLVRDGSNPLLLYGYGSYGYSLDAGFRSDRLSLIDRGFVYAIAHVRGGQELGRQWYEDGKLLRKKNTFTDFIDCAEHLVHEGYASKDRLFAMGGSAGGLLIGAVANMRPDLFEGLVAAVPFVDVVTTMLDERIPLTTGEYDEWGNPNNKTYYDYMLSYSPYDNVRAREYPNLLVTTGLHDSQVQYWEPAKWVARLRAMTTGENVVLLRTNMDAGHGGASGRFRGYRESAFTYAFLLDLAGIGK